MSTKSDCQYSQYKVKGLEQSMYCSLTHDYCIKQRYCPTKCRLVNTDDWANCTQLKKEELQMTKNNTTSKVEKEVKVTEPISKAEDTKTIESAIDKATKVEESVKYEIILATSCYFIINKDGNNVTINKLNNYKKGDMISL